MSQITKQRSEWI